MPPQRKKNGQFDPIPDEDRQRVLDLHAQGMSRNDIARETGISAGSVTNIVTAAGLSFDRTATAAATAARQADLADRRTSLREKFLDRADELLARLDEPEVVFNFGGRENTYAEHQFSKPTASTARTLIQAAATASTQEIRIAQAEAGGTDEAARSLLTSLANALGVHGPDQPPTPDAPDGD